MKIDNTGQIVLSMQELLDLYMTDPDRKIQSATLIDPDCNTTKLDGIVEVPHIARWEETTSVGEFDQHLQSNWRMPQQYRDMDICGWVIEQCTTQEQLQRVGQELILYQQRDAIDLLRYLKYLVDTMRQHGCMWGVGRGSSVASYVLYLIGVHRIDSLKYDLSITEFFK